MAGKLNGEDKVYNLEFGSYRLIVNAVNSSRGIIPLVNVLRDPRTHDDGNGNPVTEYKQVWVGDLVEFLSMMERCEA